MTTATCLAHPNIALAKYWGKQPFLHNLPAVPSLSVTLSGMATRTEVTFDAAIERDTLELNGKDAGGRPLERAIDLLDRVRTMSGLNLRARIRSRNDFPTASGLASSASAFAALAGAAWTAAGQAWDSATLSDLARQISVSSARSLFGGFVELPRGEQATTALPARQIADELHWDLRIVVAVTAEGEKSTSSTLGMEHTVRTSPYFTAWTEAAPGIFSEIREALLERDLARMGAALEQSALAMHASAMAAQPGVVYFAPGTLAALHEVRALRARGVPAYATMDAGPHVKVVTEAAHEETVVKAMAGVPGVLRTIRTQPGAGARVIDRFEDGT